MEVASSFSIFATARRTRMPVFSCSGCSYAGLNWTPLGTPTSGNGYIEHAECKRLAGFSFSTLANNRSSGLRVTTRAVSTHETKRSDMHQQRRAPDVQPGLP